MILDSLLAPRGQRSARHFHSHHQPKRTNSNVSPVQAQDNAAQPTTADFRMTLLDLFNPLHASFEQNQPTIQNRRVTFAPTVQVLEIPSHREMDDTERDALWMRMNELDVNARRNMLEWIADGQDWRRAKEDDEFVLLPPTGELVHPTTYALWSSAERARAYWAQKRSMSSFRTVPTNHTIISSAAA